MRVADDTKIFFPPANSRNLSLGRVIFLSVGLFLLVLIIFSTVWIITNSSSTSGFYSRTENGRYEEIIHEKIEVKILVERNGKLVNFDKNSVDGGKKNPHSRVIDDKKENEQCSSIPDELRFDCHPEDGSAQSNCESRGCCWAKPQNPVLKSKNSIGVPWCFYPPDFPSYYMVNYTVIQDVITIFLARNTSSYYPKDVKQLRVDIRFSTNQLRVKIYDPVNTRYEVPYPLKQLNQISSVEESKLGYEIKNYPFSLKIFHKEKNQVLFDTTVGTFIYTDQFIQFSTSTFKYIYGLGERNDNFLRSTDWQRYLFLSVDQYPIPNANLYGSHPFMLQATGNGDASGILLYNSNAMEVVLQPAPAATFRMLGGIVDLVIFSGDSPSAVTSEYIETIGLPAMPPFWSLGFHLSRFGLETANETRELWQRNRNASIPFDVQWNDIDYMDNRKDFTFDKKKFAELPKLVDDIHKSDMYYVVIIDPAMDTPKNPDDYPPYADGLKRGIFINGSDGKPFIGKVWSPSGAAFPDFTNPATTDFWTDHISEFHKQIPVDGLWIDMNEPSNFYDGTITGCPNSTYETPPYVPHVLGGKLYHKTVCMTAKQYAGLHYNVHNLYGISETIATNKALKTIRPGKRPFIISRSTFPGQGYYGGHWTGDVFSTWDELKKSIPGILDFNLFGIPMVGADICGFNGNTTLKLCQRWMELGAFYPFSRNHNTDDAIDQDPAALGDDVIRASRYALTIRYVLLPYIYTQFYNAHTNGETVARPLFFEFPADEATYPIDTQFLLGPGFMVLPALDENVTEIDVYMPKSRWYVLSNDSIQTVNSTGKKMKIQSPLDKIVLAFRGGVIFPIKKPGVTTAEVRKNVFGLLVALDESGVASGELFWDDGESLDTIESGRYNFIKFDCSKNILHSTVVKAGAVNQLTNLQDIEVLGMTFHPTSVKVNGKEVKFVFSDDKKVMHINSLKIDLSKKFIVTWS